jgi:hypothetical protein
MTALAKTNDELIFSSERMIHKDINLKFSIGQKITGRESRGACRKDKPIDGKPPVVK